MEIRKAEAADHPQLLGIWLDSVRATHDFLSEPDIEALVPVVRDQVLAQLELWVLCRDAVPVGFMGLAGNKLEALFISPACFGHRGGKRMLAHARGLKGPLTVDVNEQNHRATAFYLANGFSVTGRSALDGAGRAFPLLHLAEPDAQQASARACDSGDAAAR